MNWFKDKSTYTKLMACFGLFALMIAFVGYQGISSMSKTNVMLENVYRQQMAGVTAIKEVNIEMLKLSRIARQTIIDTEPGPLQQDSQDFTNTSAELNRRLTEAQSFFTTDEGKRIFADIRQNVSTYAGLIKAMIPHAISNDNKVAAEMAKSAVPSSKAAMAAIDVASALKEKEALDVFQASQTTYSSTRTVVVGIVIAAMILAILIGYSIARMIVTPLLEMVGTAQSLAKGNLDQQVTYQSKDEVGTLADAFRNMISSFSMIITDIRLSSDQVAATAGQLSTASQQIATGAQEQAASLEETSATLEEITSTVKQNADNAKQANQLASGAKEAAEKGGSVMGSAVGAMNEINSASTRIAEIISTIDEIAFQTNLLALNAAVEAARAGEQGRGFAVVAAEVRNLAQRSATAAKEIKGLIQDSVTKVGNGSQLVHNSGLTLEDIVARVKRVTDIVGEIAAASQEQATGVEQVAKAMAQMDQVTQANSGHTEEMSSTAEELSSTAANLQQLVSRFVTKNTGNNGFASTPRTTFPKPKTVHSAKPVRPASSNGHHEPALVSLASHTGFSENGFEEF